MARTSFMIAAAVFALACGQAPVRAQSAAAAAPVFASSGDSGFDAWRTDFAARAVARGKSPDVVRTLLSGIAPDPRIVELDQSQPEFVSPVWDYVERRVSPQRVAAGRALKTELGETLSAIEQRYGVDGDIVLGIWGLESNFGEVDLNYAAAAALSTLAFEGRRREQFETYLFALIDMVERNLAGPDQLKSSWAGALGQPQFMPDVFLTTAVDWDEDGHADIWTNRADVAASIAHYLSDRGWRAGEPTFDEVQLPAGFDYAQADGTARSVAAWEALGVAKISGAPWSQSDKALSSQLFLPAGARGPALLLHHNFAVIRRYNNSDRYALVVSLLARSVAGQAGTLNHPWPRNLLPLGRDQILELQTLLGQLGYESGTPDGLFGSGTRRAVRGYQAAHGETPDGFPTIELLNKVRAQAGVRPTPLDAAGIRELQRALNRQGFSVGRADGRIGARTRAAIRAFQRRYELAVTGRATSDVLEAARARN
jgi:membrane-bound lytic murein transglycosylase B